MPFQPSSQNSGSHLSRLSAPLFTEDRYSSSTENDQDACDSEVNNITSRTTPSPTPTIVLMPPRTVSYHPPVFNLNGPTRQLTKDEQLEVHHNYISAVSNLEHKKDLINRLKRSEPHNISTYEAEMTHDMTMLLMFWKGSAPF